MRKDYSLVSELGKSNMTDINNASKVVFSAPSDDWMSIAYKTAWSQYAHEDELRHNKNVLYISIQTALFMIISGAIAVFKKPLLVTIGTTFNLAPVVLGLLFIGIAIFAIHINGYWEHVIRAGRAWMYLRYVTARVIEHKAGLAEFGPATLEHTWSVYSERPENKQKPLDRKMYFPFEHIPELKDVGLYIKPPTGESTAALSIVRTLKVLWSCVAVLGELLVLSFFIFR